MPLVFSFSMFILSFAPLWISILFIDTKSIIEKQTNIVTEISSIITIIIISTISLVILIFSLKKSEQGNQEYTIESVAEEKSITAEFLLSYILPLFAFNFTLWHQVVLFLIFYSILTFLCIRHNYFSVNIVLELFGYRFFRCNLQNEDGQAISKVIISKEMLLNRKNERILLHPINNDYSVDFQDWE